MRKLNVVELILPTPYWDRPGNRERMSKLMIEKWKDPVYRAHHKRGMQQHKRWKGGVDNG